ncbi:MAG: MoxR family ATPase [Eubacteriales bacterium]|nr:MoxR family ATPase [Eubacteriales bacterium]
MTVTRVKELSDRLLNETEKIIVGKTDKIRLIIMSVFAGGHVLLEDLPGVGKTTLIKALSTALGCDFRRIQFVPDLMPSDISGMRIFNQKSGEFELVNGPVMTNILLADEINRAIPRTQSALLEAMEERQVTIDGESIKLPEPFLVLATQNPVESESTFPLPAAQMDRFLIKLSLGYPSQDEELRMLGVLGDRIPFENVNVATNADELTTLIKEISKVRVSEAVAGYIVRIVDATRNNKELRMGASPRGSRALYKAVKVWAAMNGRDYAIPDDVLELAHPVLEHRLVLSSEAGFAGHTVEDVLDTVIAGVTPPPTEAELLS